MRLLSGLDSVGYATAGFPEGWQADFSRDHLSGLDSVGYATAGFPEGWQADFSRDHRRLLEYLELCIEVA